MTYIIDDLRRARLQTKPTLLSEEIVQQIKPDSSSREKVLFN